ncbi:pentatricopeptide repeat-containing protein, mitochondrial [Trifolium repens]|nr:pentatricopeptide repeat-containing protein, mitochondrial [Trifolium repens]
MTLSRSFRRFPNLVTLSTKSYTHSLTSSHFDHNYSTPIFQFIQNPSGSLKFHIFPFHTSRANKPKTTNPDAETICKILSTKPDSPVDVSLANFPVEVSPELVVDVLNKLSNAGILALSFFRWAEKQNGFKHNTEIFHALIEALGKIKQFKMIWNLVDDMKQRKLLNGDTFTLIARRYVRARIIKEALKTFERMEKYGLKPQISDFNKLIDVLCKSKFHVEKAQELFDKMTQWNLEPNLKSYTILLEGWSQQQNLLRVREVCREMRDEGFEPDVVTYGILINAYCKAKKYDEAIDFYHEMQSKNISPSPHIYCTLIIGLGNGNRLDEALEFFEKSKVSGFPPEVPTYNAVVGAYCWAGRIDDACRIVDEMRELGIGPNSRTYDIILVRLIKGGRAKEAYSVFKRMSSEVGCEPRVSTYEIMVRMFCNEDQLDLAMVVWDEMKDKGILPGIHMFSTLIISLCHENKLDEACKYFQQMLDVGIRPTTNMFSAFKKALMDAGMENTVLHFAQKVDKLRNTPLIA